MLEYCVYTTTYKGKAMPPYYIGSSSIKKIEDGYFGSVSSKTWKKLWFKELKENPQLFSIKIISRHKTRKTALLAEKKLQKKKNAINSHLYINKALADGNFIYDWSGIPKTKEQNRKNSEAHKGKKKSKETIEKIRKARLKQIISKETKEKISKKLKGIKKSRGTRQKMKFSWINYPRNNKQIRCIELDIIFNKCKDAAVFVKLADSSMIGQVAKGNRKSAGGFTWEFV